eukprot:scaffold72817_cov71-Phaeocystis_antarctica.AAC.1
MAAALEQLEVGRRLAAEHLDGHAHFPDGLLAVGVALLGQLQQRRDVDAAAARRLLEHAQHGELGADGLARAGGRADERALVESLSVEMTCVWIGLKCVKAGVLAQRRDGQRTQVEQLRVRRVLLRQDEVQKETGSVVSAPSQLSETMRMKYCGGSGSQIGMVKVIV